MLGTVRNFEGTFGFILPDDGGKEIFVHFSDIISRPGAFRTLRGGERVGFEAEETQRGLAARNVQRLDAPEAE